MSQPICPHRDGILPQARLCSFSTPAPPLPLQFSLDLRKLVTLSLWVKYVNQTVCVCEYRKKQLAKLRIRAIMRALLSPRLFNASQPRRNRLNKILLDDIDVSIVRQLQYDGRLPFTKIAAELGISEGAVRRRVKRLTDSGLLQIVAVAEPQHLGWSAAGMIGITVRAGQVDAVAQQLAQFPEVSYLFMASGEFDLFAEVFCSDREHFVSFLNEKLQQVPDVKRTLAFMILKMYKLSYRWGESEPPRVGHTAHISLLDHETNQ